ncbi:unnamed protein product [Acanthoscelides obtectus]|uniref:SRP9 domain-containing protein n=1 Tax=Acanthoscelides obtectus TaxID=200917 RepID=A0A9P0LBY8_ACAOB|nr:unnamed protein product [Acanthoscelides obtectus]CAK1624445.1 Signal recognition particle 9 kDa protein [Acanthoscelides obtectus]
MTYLNSWEDFEKEAERLYLQSPWKVRYTLKYVHSKNQLILKMTDDLVVLYIILSDYSQNNGFILFSVCSLRQKLHKTSGK